MPCLQKWRWQERNLLCGSFDVPFPDDSYQKHPLRGGAVLHEDAPAALGASNLFERQSIDVLTMAFDFPVLDIPHMRVCNVGAFVICTV